MTDSKRFNEGRAERDHPTQQTKPVKGEPVEIPVPTEDQIENLLNRAAQPLKSPRD